MRSFLATLFAALFAAGAAAQEAAPGNAAFTVVEVHLASRTFERTLPFDVPFVVAGPVPEGAHLVEIRCWGARTAHDLDAAMATTPSGDCWHPATTPTWNRVPGVEEEAGRFFIAVPRLEAEHHYRFRFSWDKEVSEEDAAAFNLAVREVLGDFFWRRSFGDLDAAEGEALRRSLVAALATVTGADRIVRTDSLFDATVPFAEIQDRFFVSLQGLLEAEDRRHDRVERYVAARERLKGVLLALRADPVMTRWRTAIAALAAANPDLAGAAAEASVIGDGVGEGLRDPRALGGEEGLEEFLAAARDVYADGGRRLDGLAATLGGALRDDGAPGDLFLPFVEADPPTFDRGDLAHLQSLAADGGSLARARTQVAILEQYVDTSFPDLLAYRREALAEVAAAYETLVRTSLVVSGSTSGDFATQHKNYVSFDGGLAWAPGLEDFVTYSGTNIYLRPVNKEAPLAQLGSFRETLGRRFAFTLGLTVEGVAEEGPRPTRQDLFGNQSLVLGAGLRVTQSLRLTAGALVFRQRGRNPLSDDVRLAVTPYVAVSFDVDVAPLLNGIGSRF